MENIKTPVEKRFDPEVFETYMMYNQFTLNTYNFDMYLKNTRKNYKKIKPLFKTNNFLNLIIIFLYIIIFLKK